MIFPVVSQSSDQTSYQGFSLLAHWLQGLSVPQTRKLVQVVNGRALRDRLLQQAMLNSFKQLLLPGQFPALALFLEINPSEIDVNVHPTKTEIRFLDTRKVFHAIDSIVSAMVGKHGAPTYAAQTETPLWSARETSAPTTPSLWNFSQPAAEPATDTRSPTPAPESTQLQFGKNTSARYSPLISLYDLGDRTRARRSTCRARTHSV